MNIAVITDKSIEYSHKDCNITFFTSGDDVSPVMWADYEAAFLLMPVSADAFEKWTGHPHVRCVGTLSELNEEIDFLFKNIECEIKLLIKTPDIISLSKYRPFKAGITQVYLSDSAGHRIRKRTAGDIVTYIETLKIRVSPTVSKEYENVLSEMEYNELLQKADANKHPIIKNRYYFFFENQYFELDIYDFWDDRATLELELKRENDKYTLPPEIEVIKDVTTDSRYKNNHLAGVKYEDYNTELL